jgi:hypothetical protein
MASGLYFYSRRSARFRAENLRPPIIKDELGTGLEQFIQAEVLGQDLPLRRNSSPAPS